MTTGRINQVSRVNTKEVAQLQKPTDSHSALGFRFTSILNSSQLAVNKIGILLIHNLTLHRHIDNDDYYGRQSTNHFAQSVYHKSISNSELKTNSNSGTRRHESTTTQ